MNYVTSRRWSRSPSPAGSVLLGLAALGAVILLVRELPDLVRYLRVKRM